MGRMDPGWDVFGRPGSRSCVATFFTRTAVRGLYRLAKRSGLATAWCRRFAVSHASCLSGGLRRKTRLVVSRQPSLPPAGDILGVTFPWWGVVYYPWSAVPPPPLPPAPPSGLGRRRALSTFVLGARRGPPPLPPPPCALSGAAWVPRLRPLQARLAQLRPRSSTTPSPFDLCSWSRCPSCTFAAATAASMLHRYVGAKGLLLSSRLGDQRRRVAPKLGFRAPSCGVPCARTEASVGT